jgi:hypothetical protein
MLLDAATLLAGLNDLERRLTSSDQAWVREDLRMEVLNVCAAIGPALDLARLDSALGASAAVDANSLRAGAALFARVPVADYALPGSETFDAKARVAALQSFADSASTASDLSELEWTLRLHLIGNGHFDTLLTALRDHEDDLRRKLRDLVREKTELLTDEEAVKLLGQYEAETEPSREVRIELNGDTASKTMFRADTSKDARDRAADYVVLHRPRLKRKMLEAGRRYVPAEFNGIAQILCWKTKATPSLTRTDEQVVTAVARVSFCWDTVLDAKHERAELAVALGVPADGAMFSGRTYAKIRESFRRERPKPTSAALIAELRKLVRLAMAVTAPSPVEETLRRYKAGVEIMAPEVRASLVKDGGRIKHEEYFQREVCRFLVERGHYATGTKFGRSEVDLRVDDSVGAILMEVKVARSAPSESQVRAWFSQLQRYMGEAPFRTRGALLVFNLSSTALLAPVGFIHGRFLVVAVNLSEVTPSRTTESIVIEESTDPGVFLNVRRNKRLDAGSRTKRR